MFTIKLLMLYVILGTTPQISYLINSKLNYFLNICNETEELCSQYPNLGLCDQPLCESHPTPKSSLLT